MPPMRRQRHKHNPLPSDEPRIISAENSQQAKLRVIAYSKNLSHVVTDLRSPAYWKNFGQGALDELCDEPWPIQIPRGYRNGRHRVNQFQTGRYPKLASSETE